MGAFSIRKHWRAITLLSAVSSLMVLLALGCAITCRPSWYQPRSIDYGLLQQDKQDLTNLIDEISAALNAGRDIEISITQEQVNRWLAARSEVPAVDFSQLGELDQPFLVFLEGNRIRAAAIVRRAGVSTVASLTIQVASDEQAVRFSTPEVRAGVAPAPRTLVEQLLGRALSGAGAARLTEAATLEFPNQFVWQNGKRRFRINSIEVTDGRLSAALGPLR